MINSFNFDNKKLNQIWNNYVNYEVKKLFDLKSLRSYNLQTEAPCPECGNRLVKAAFYASQPHSNCSWTLRSKDGNNQNEMLDNFQPIHPKCLDNKKSTN